MWRLKPPPGLPRTGCVCLHSWVLPNYGSTDREPPEPAEPVELVEPVKPAKPVKPVKPVAPGNLGTCGTCGICGTCGSIHFFVKKKMQLIALMTFLTLVPVL